jgi:phytoene dehydrogenase-like protein
MGKEMAMNGVENHAGLDADLVVVGGGLAGLIAAAMVAREGRSVVVLDRAKALGGRAVTHQRDGVSFNLGPHALYCKGDAFRRLEDLRIPFTGRFPNAGTGLAIVGKTLAPIPAGLRSLLTSRLLTLREKGRLALLLCVILIIASKHLKTLPP